MRLILDYCHSGKVSCDAFRCDVLVRSWSCYSCAKGLAPCVSID